ncbi:MAG TPA: sulfoxide reductase heme-binding subunit YedZ, partial [Pasteurellaceae bacterium]|nr:sulfoxide reductase heme-binding subunit YedZ [Pasteurellaceae bacterium]
MSKVKMLVHFLCALPLCWLSLVLLFGDDSQLGADPIKETLHFLGFVALTLFMIIFIFKLCLSILNKNRLQPIHQTIGLWAFTYM